MLKYLCYCSAMYSSIYSIICRDKLRLPVQLKTFFLGSNKAMGIKCFVFDLVASNCLKDDIVNCVLCKQNPKTQTNTQFVENLTF